MFFEIHSSSVFWNRRFCQMVSFLNYWFRHPKVPELYPQVLDVLPRLPAPSRSLPAAWAARAASPTGSLCRWTDVEKITSLRVIPTVTLYWNIFVTNSDILSALRSLDFIRIILSSSSLLLVRGPAVTTVIYQAKLTQTDSRYAWFKTISDARASPDA